MPDASENLRAGETGILIGGGERVPILSSEDFYEDLVMLRDLLTPAEPHIMWLYVVCFSFPILEIKILTSHRSISRPEDPPQNDFPPRRFDFEQIPNKMLGTQGKPSPRKKFVRG
jgi:hypothetical protein